MTNAIQYINDASLPRPNGFTQVASAPADRLIFISGQIACDANGNIVGAGDIAAQARQVFTNLSHALESAGSDFQHVVKLTFFVKNISEATVAAIREVRNDFLAPDRLPASTIVGVTGLVKEDLLLEIEAYAVQKRA